VPDDPTCQRSAKRDGSGQGHPRTSVASMCSATLHPSTRARVRLAHECASRTTRERSRLAWEGEVGDARCEEGMQGSRVELPGNEVWWVDRFRVSLGGRFAEPPRADAGDPAPGWKSQRSYHDGYKGHIAIDPESELITSATLTKGNVFRCRGRQGAGLAHQMGH